LVDAAERHALTGFCEELLELRKECSQLPEDRERLLQRIEEEARTRRPILALLARLLGTDTADTLRALSSGLPGAGPGQADEETFSCPDGACDRKATSPYPTGPIPRCPLTDQRMSKR
jgi:hypothetical protein